VQMGVELVSIGWFVGVGGWDVESNNDGATTNRIFKVNDPPPLLISHNPPPFPQPHPTTTSHGIRRWCPQAAPVGVGLKWIHQLDYATSGVLCIGLSRRCVCIYLCVWMDGYMKT
jgi:hypothetical protein